MVRNETWRARFGEPETRLRVDDSILTVWRLLICLVLSDRLQELVSGEDRGDTSVLSVCICEDLLAEDQSPMLINNVALHVNQVSE